MPEQPARSWSRSEQEPEVVAAPAPDEPVEQTELAGAKQVVLAARVVKAAGGLAIAAIGVHVLRTLLRLRR